MPPTALLAALALAPSASQSPLAWIEQFGTSQSDAARCAASDGSDGVVLGGETHGSLGAPGQGGADAWVAQRDSAGAPLWTRQLGTTQDDSTWCVVSDVSGAVFAGGTTRGSLGGGVHHGQGDAWVARFDAIGSLLWVQQFGTPGDERAQAVLPDGHGGVYVSGYTTGSLGAANAGLQDAWLTQLAPSGQPMWFRQIGTSGNENATCLAAAPAGRFLVGGVTEGSLAAPAAGGFDCWVALFAGGNSVWSFQLGTDELDGVFAIGPDGAGGALAAITTEGALGATPAGGFDACLARIDAGGSLAWIRQFGTPEFDAVNALVPDGSGGCTLAGSTLGGFGGANAGLLDVWLARFDASGEEWDRRQFGSNNNDLCYAAAASSGGSTFTAGQTYGLLGSSGTGGPDAWVAKAAPACPPVSTYCTPSATSIPGCTPSTSAQGTPSLAHAGEFELRASPAPGGHLGLCLFSAHGPANLPFGTLGGALCVAAPLHRSPLKAASGHTGICDGALAFTLLELAQASPIIVPGARIHAQLWCRDPANSDGFWLSDGLSFEVCP
jgi:hypothetical protein